MVKCGLTERFDEKSRSIHFGGPCGDVARYGGSDPSLGNDLLGSP